MFGSLISQGYKGICGKLYYLLEEEGSQQVAVGTFATTFRGQIQVLVYGFYHWYGLDLGQK